MEEVLYYLELKNKYYDKFYGLTLKFIQSNRNHRWNRIDLLVDNRERILNIIRTFNIKIGKILEREKITEEQVQAHREKVQSLYKERKATAEKIVALDLQLISAIDEMKTETIRELKQLQETQQQMHSYAGAPLSKPPKHESEA